MIKQTSVLVATLFITSLATNAASGNTTVSVPEANITVTTWQFSPDNNNSINTGYNSVAAGKEQDLASAVSDALRKEGKLIFIAKNGASTIAGKTTPLHFSSDGTDYNYAVLWRPTFPTFENNRVSFGINVQNKIDKTIEEGQLVTPKERGIMDVHHFGEKYVITLIQITQKKNI